MTDLFMNTFMPIQLKK